jgi:hypothetical protein
MSRFCAEDDTAETNLCELLLSEAGHILPTECSGVDS